MQLNIFLSFHYPYSLVEDKKRPSPIKIEENEETSPPEANSPSSYTLDTIDSIENTNPDDNNGLNNDIDNNNNATISNSSGHDNVADDNNNLNNGIADDNNNLNNDIDNNNNVSDGEKNTADNNNDNYDNNDAATKMYELEPITVHEMVKDCASISLGDGVFVQGSLASIENYRYCLLISADEMNVFLKIGYFYPDRGIFVYGAYTEADALSSLKLVFIKNNLGAYTSISWKYFLNKRYSPATQKVKEEVNIKLPQCMSNNLTV